MREIKFRAFHKPTNRMFEVYGLGKDWCTEYTIDGIDPYVNYFDGDEFKNDIVIIQFTGLTDKNGKEIYEGDIVECHYFYEALGKNYGVYEAERIITGSISFNTYGLRIDCDSDEDSGYLLFINGLHEESFEIVGNIHENKDQ